MKTPEEIKKGLECSVSMRCIKTLCPYFGCDEDDSGNCIRNAQADALAYIQQLERERDAAVEGLKDTGMLCVYCLHEKKSIYEEPCNKCSRANADAKRNNWQWRGVEVEG